MSAADFFCDALGEIVRDAVRSALDDVAPTSIESPYRPMAVDVATASELVGLSERTIRTLIKAGKFPALRSASNRVLVPITALEAWIEANTQWDNDPRSSKSAPASSSRKRTPSNERSVRPGNRMLR